MRLLRAMDVPADDVMQSPADDIMETPADGADCSDDADFSFYCGWLFHRKMFISPQISLFTADDYFTTDGLFHR